MDRIDFRSDTVTWPTRAMRVAMAGAEVGDDVYGEDPTVNQLESLAADMLAKEAGLFVSSGTMGNLVAILAHAGRGDEAIVGEDAHTFCHEAGGMSVLGGIVPRPLPTDAAGRMDLRRIQDAVRPDDPHYPRSRLILLENTYGDKVGFAIPEDYFAGVSQIARQHNLVVHLDGARFFNAAVALDIPPSAITRHVDSVSVCLSKGLCAPVGSVLCGSTAFIDRARRVRKVLGGGMRQAGVLAAAGVVALQQMVERLAEDHARARRLAQGLAEIDGIQVDPASVTTNMVFFSLDEQVSATAQEVARCLRVSANVWLGALDARTFRAVTHYWVDEDAVDECLGALRSVLRGI